jgi:hypothetical protein
MALLPIYREPSTKETFYKSSNITKSFTSQTKTMKKLHATSLGSTP